MISGVKRNVWVCHFTSQRIGPKSVVLINLNVVRCQSQCVIVWHSRRKRRQLHATFSTQTDTNISFFCAFAYLNFERRTQTSFNGIQWSAFFFFFCCLLRTELYVAFIIVETRYTDAHHMWFAFTIQGRLRKIGPKSCENFQMKLDAWVNREPVNTKHSSAFIYNRFFDNGAAFRHRN